MKKIRNCIFIFLLLHCFTPLSAQHIVLLYFDSGISKISPKHEEELKLIKKKYASYELDSVNFIGVADSIGSAISNLRLSVKRAENAAAYVQKLFDHKGPRKITGTGERLKGVLSRNRCVKITFYFGKRKATESVKKTEPIRTTDPDDKPIVTKPRKPGYCYYIDYFLLQKSFITTVTEGDKEFIRLEITQQDLPNKNLYYTAIISDTGLVPVVLKWDSVRTGELWWEQYRFVTSIPKKDFDNYKVFRMGNPPCIQCHVEFTGKYQIPTPDVCMKTDSFLMNNMQVKSIPSEPRMVKVRVPAKYVRANTRYFTNCGGVEEIKWQTEQEGGDIYFYTKLPMHEGHVADIAREMDCCYPENIKDPNTIACGGMPSGPVLCAPKPFQFEAGTHYQQSKNTPYIAIGLVLESRFSRVSLLAGTDIDKSFYSSLRYQFHFFTRPYGSLNPNWRKKNNVKVYERFVRLYTGTELKLRKNKTEGDYLEQNIHIGVASVNSKDLAFFNRIFLQYGCGLDYLKNNAAGLYSIGQFGVNIELRKPRLMWKSFKLMFTPENKAKEN